MRQTRLWLIGFFASGVLGSGLLPLHAAASSLPLAFEANEGQWKAEVRFVARARTGLVLLDEQGAVLIPDSRSGETLRIALVGSRSRPLIQGLEPLAQTSNYFVGKDSSAWRQGIRTYRRVVYQEIYRGIDMVFHSSDSGELEYDFIVHPESDPRTIRLRFDGAASVRIEQGGELVIRTGDESIRMKAPAIYQTIEQRRTPITGRYRILRNRAVGFVVGDYDRSNDLVIDPVVLGFSTYLGGTDSESATDIAVDADRNTYIAGHTRSVNFPTKGGVRGTLAGGRDVFVAKLNPAGDQILFSTFLGGTGDDSVSGSATLIALDSHGDIVLGGVTASTDFPVTEGAPQRSFGGGASDVFVAKLSSDGSRLLFSTYLGAEAADRANGLATDPWRDIYVGGSTLSAGFPITTGAPQTMRRGPRDLFAAKIRVEPPSLVYSTYLGGSDEDFGLNLAVDSAGAAYLTGRTLSTDYPITSAAFQRSFGGAGTGSQRTGDGFVTKINPSGSSLEYSTFLGGLSGDIPTAVVVDSAGAAYITGLTYSRNFPITAGSLQPQHGGGDADNFVTKLAPEGDRLVFSTFLGGNNSEQANAIAVDALGNVHVSGTTSATDFPTTSDALSRTRKGTNDGFVSIISPDGSQLLYSTYLGGTAPSGGPQDNNWAIAVDSAGNTYTGGQTRSADFPLTAGAPQAAYSGMDDAYITKFTVQRDRPEGELRVVPVVGSTPGALGSFFKTSFQLHNPRNGTIGGRFIFHPQGRSGSDGDPYLDYFLGPGETIAISDLLPAMSQAGLGSIDLVTPDGQAPESVIRIFNDAGEAGTTGMSEEQIRMAEVLGTGMTGVLIAPASTERARFNIGIRTLADGASLTITVRRSDGTVSQTITRNYPANFFEQRSAADFLGIPPGPNDSIALRIDSGSAVLYGSTTDDITQDPSLQLARDVDSILGETRPYLLVVGSTPGALGSFFKTSVQLHNPGSAPLSGWLIYHAQGTIGSDADPSLAYSLQPGETISYQDLLPAMGQSGVGNIDLIPTSGPPPLSVARIYNDAGARGTTGMTEDQVSSENVLWRGDEGILLTPPDPARARLNIGIRTLGEGATITMTVRTSFGNVVKTVTKSFDPVFFSQLSAEALLETKLLGNESIRVKIDQGSAIVYGATTDNITQDPMLKLVRRLE
ncbi:MAG TPA: SBBP repeat-containing protein [Thermoanaerobaculia bacterium]|nr:SBBP repeat-containing protein [Thermoanaerobaculia bacterium]